MIDFHPQIIELSNGLKVVYLFSPSAVSHLGITFLAGSRYEQSNEVGLAHFLEHCIFKGTQKRKTVHILSRLDSVGGELNAYTTKEEICVYASFVENHFNRAAELLSDIVQNSVFPEKEIEKEKEIVLDELNSYLDAPSDKIMDDFEALLFPNHPLGNNILGSPESVDSFTRQQLLDYTKRFFVASNAVVSFVGSTKLPQVKARLEKYFGQLEKGEVKITPLPFTESIPIQKSSAESNYQAHGMIGGIAPGYSSDDRRAMTLLTNVLGGPALNSRLTLTVREKYGYSYNIEASYTPFAETGYWYVYFGTDQKYLKKTKDLVLKELKKMREVPFTAKQLAEAKEQLKGHIALSLDSNVGLMQGLGKSLLLFGQIDTIATIHQEIDALTIEDLQQAAIRYFNVDNMSELLFEVK